jgi:hypothetical protein
VSSSLLDGGHVNPGGIPEKTFWDVQGCACATPSWPFCQSKSSYHHEHAVPVRAESRLLDDILALLRAFGVRYVW